jgi:hypothetical protein
MEKKYPIGGYAPGNYRCLCYTCKMGFDGDKRACQCEPCAVNDLREALKPYDQPPAEAERGKGAVWVKASERLPSENGGKYFVKFRESKCVCHYYNDRFQSTEWGLMDNNALIWLDESAGEKEVPNG